MSRFFNRLFLTGALFAIAGVILCGIAFRNFFCMLSPAVDLYEVEDWSSLKKGDHIRTEVDFLWDYFYYTYDTETGTDEARAYMISNIVLEGDDIVVKEHLGVMVSDNGEFNKYENLVRTSSEWWMDTTGNVPFPTNTITVEGYLRKLKADEREYLVEYIMDDWNLSESQAEEYVCPYMIVPYEMSDSLTMIVMAGICFVVGLILAALGFFVGRR